MAEPDDTLVLVVEPDARTRAALGALIEATPGLRVAAATGSPVDAVAVSRSTGATVAVVDIDADPHDVGSLTTLAEHLAVVAVGDTTPGTARFLAAGAAAVCDKHGDPDALISAIGAAAGERHERTRTPTETDPGPWSPEPDTP
jgi:DNA-binding NarL/FixJ family response regulator